MAGTAAVMCALLVGRESGAIIGLAVAALTASVWVLPFALRWWQSQNVHYAEAEKHLKAGNWSQAEKWCQAIADVAKQPGVKADMLAKVALCQAKERRYAEALETVAKAMPFAKQPEVKSRLLTAKAEAQLGMGEGAAAAASQREALTLAERKSKDKKAIAERLLELGKTLTTTDPAQAIETLQQALEEYRTVYGEGAPEFAKPLKALAEAHLNTGDAASAITHLEQCSKLIEQTLTTDAPDFMAATEKLAEAYDLAGRYEDAVATFERAVALHERHVGKSTPEFITALMYLAAHYCAEGEYARAMELARLAHGQMGIARDPRLNEGLELLAIIYERSGRPAEAAEFRSKKAAVA